MNTVISTSEAAHGATEARFGFGWGFGKRKKNALPDFESGYRRA